MKRLLLKRRNNPITRMDLGSRTRHWSSWCEMSRRWCSPHFNAPGRPICLKPAGGGEFCRRHTAHQRDGFRGVVAQVPPQERDLFDAGEIHFLGRRRA
jgi:hypothetical protein